LAEPEPPGNAARTPLPQLFKRLASICVFVPGILFLVWAGNRTLLLLVLLIVVRGAWEFFRLLRAAGYRPAASVGILSAAGLVFHIRFLPADRLALTLSVVVLLGLIASLRHGTERYVANAVSTFGGAILFGLLGSAPLLIAAAAPAAETAYLLMAIFLCTWATDAGAYICGHLWGRRKLAPSISPGKTRLGFAAGLAAGMVPLLFHDLLPMFSTAELVGLFLLASAGGQLGDLIESAWKRDVGVKDSPALIPGHGGVLDRFDSYFFAFPLAYIYLIALPPF
jgi:phosphatidate cytidylyltransferase